MYVFRCGLIVLSNIKQLLFPEKVAIFVNVNNLVFKLYTMYGEVGLCNVHTLDCLV